MWSVRSVSSQMLWKKHNGPVDDSGLTVADLVELKLDGPREESDIVVRIDDGGPLTLTDFGRECAQLWVEEHGRRFSCYKRRIDFNVKRGAKGGTDRAVVERRRAAADALVELAGQPSVGKEPTFGECTRDDLRPKSRHGRFGANRFWNGRFAKIQKRHRHKAENKVGERRGSPCGQAPISKTNS